MVNVAKKSGVVLRLTRACRYRRIVPFWLITSFLLFSALAHAATVTTYYLDAVNGDNDNPGTSDAPWKTIDRAKIRYAADPNVAAGDTVIFAAGNYGEWIWGGDDFTNEGDWITYKADTDANVVFDELNWANGNEVHIKLEGLKFICAGYGTLQDPYTVVFAAVDYVDMNNCYIRGADSTDWYGAGMKVTVQSQGNCNHITLRNSEIYDCTTALGFSDPNNLTIENCEIHRTSDDLISGAQAQNMTINNCYLHDAAPLYEFRLIDGDDTVSGEFQQGESVVQDTTNANGTIIFATDRTGTLILYLDVNGYPEEPLSGYNFSYRDLTDVNFVGSGLNDFNHTDVVHRLDYHFKVEIDGIGEPDTFAFKYSSDGETWYTVSGRSEIPITGSTQPLYNNDAEEPAYSLVGTFGATTGHTLGDYWVFETGEFYPITGQTSGATMRPSTEAQSGHPDAIQIYTQPDNYGWSENVTISNNIISKGEGQGVFLKQMKNVMIENNLFYGGFTSHPCAVQTSSLSGTIRNNTYCLDLEVSDISLAGNWIYWQEGGSYKSTTIVRPDASSSKLYRLTDSHTSTTDDKPGSGVNWTSYWQEIDPNDMVFNIYNNLLCGRLAYEHLSGKYLNIKNNYMGVVNYGGSAYYSQYLLGSPTIPDGTNYVKGGFLSDAERAALFTNPGANNFRLKSGSSAIDFGSSAYASATDILGVSRNIPPDAGCYEYVSADGNNAPVLEVIGNKSVDENSSLSFSINAADADGDTITYSAPNLPSGANFVSQTFNWTPNYDQAGLYPVTFIVSDGNNQDSETITITVNNTNRAPVLVSIGDKPASENSTLSFSISADDPDGDTITYSAPNLPSGAVLSAETGAFSWTPNYEQAGDYEVTFIASDGQAQDSETIAIIVGNTNRPPVLSSIGDRLVYLGDTLGFTVNAIDPDGDEITYSATDLPDGATFEAQSFSWTPDSNQTGSYDVTFYASDGQSEDSEEIAITVTIDSTAPTVSGLLPAADSIQVPLNSLISLYITDDGRGVDADTVIIGIDGNLVYSGDTEDYNSLYGHCRRAGTSASYRFFYQANEPFDYDRLTTVTVNAADMAGNAILAYSYSFRTQMRSFGANKAIVPDSCDLDKEVTATASDSSGNVWAVWHEGQAGSRNIHLARLADEADAFSSSIELTNNDFDQCNADIAIDADDKLYVVWQGNNRGNWDIYTSTSTDGIQWSTPKRVTDSNENQINPAVAVDGSLPSNVYIVWEDDRDGNGDIYGASSSNGFLTGTVWAITSEQSEQSEPAVAIDAENTVYVVWTDEREGSKDIYGASSDNGPWTNLVVVSDAGDTYNQSSPAIAAEDTGSRLHLLWADDSGEDYDIFYAETSGGLPSSPLAGSSIIDDTTDADQLAPAIAVSGSTGDDLHVFACWLDERNSDSDLYFVQVGSGSGTNVFVGDGSTNSNQNKPVMGLDKLGYPYLAWSDDRNDGSDIYYAASTYIDPQALAQEQVSAASGAVVGISPARVSQVDDVSVSIPSGAWQCDVDVKISKVQNIPEFSTCTPVTNYDIGPSGINFDKPVTVIIPYNVSDYPGPLIPYCYGPQEHNPSQDGITAIEKLVISSSIHAIRFQATHFSQFILASATDANEPNVVWRFGTFGDRRNVKLAVTGLDDSPLNLSLRGSGYGEVIQGDGLSRIVLYDTTGSTALRMSSKNRKSRCAVGDIVVNGSLRDIKAKDISLEGDLTVTGNLGRITLANVSGSNITIGSTSNPGRSVSFRFGRVSDSNINSQIPIRRLTAIDWLDNDSTADQITAPSIGKLKITGSRRGNVAGDFYADVILTGNMGRASIAGSLIDSDWSVNGCIAALAVKEASENSYVCSTGSIASISLGAAYDSDFLAGFDPDYDEQWPAAVSGFLTTVARINSFTITGLKTQPDEYYFVNTNVSAPFIGRVHLLNLQTQNSGCDFGLWTLENSAGNILASVSNKSTIDSDESFTVRQGDGIPGSVDDFWMEILEP